MASAYNSSRGKFNVIDPLIASPYFKYPKNPMPTYKNTMKTIARFNTPIEPPNDFGVLISFSNGIICEYINEHCIKSPIILMHLTRSQKKISIYIPHQSLPKRTKPFRKITETLSMVQNRVSLQMRLAFRTYNSKWLQMIQWSPHWLPLKMVPDILNFESWMIAKQIMNRRKLRLINLIKIKNKKWKIRTQLININGNNMINMKRRTSTSSSTK